MIDLRTYWPNPASGKQLIVQDEGVNGGAPFFATTHRYVKRGQLGGHDVLRKETYNSTGWLNAWQLRDDGTQMLEVGDEFPGKHLVYETGKEFTWGGQQQVGDIVTRQVHIDVAASTGVQTGPDNWATAKLTVEDCLPSFTNLGGMTFCDVVVVQMFQSFCRDAQCAWPAGQSTWRTRYWFAPDVGFIQTEFLQNPNGPISGRKNYAVGILETWETP